LEQEAAAQEILEQQHDNTYNVALNVFAEMGSSSCSAEEAAIRISRAKHPVFWGKINDVLANPDQAEMLRAVLNYETEAKFLSGLCGLTEGKSSQDKIAFNRVHNRILKLDRNPNKRQFIKAHATRMRNAADPITQLARSVRYRNKPQTLMEERAENKAMTRRQTRREGKVQMAVSRSMERKRTGIPSLEKLWGKAQKTREWHKRSEPDSFYVQIPDGLFIPGDPAPPLSDALKTPPLSDALKTLELAIEVAK
jgi:hypothetical protein